MNLPTNHSPGSEPYRPQFHFTPPANWINDPNGLVYFRNEWHLFYQYCDPTQFDGKQWGHAVSTDLVRWRHLPVAIVPDKHGDIWSGSAVVDAHDSSGLFGGMPGIVCPFTYWNPADGRQSQGLAYSADGISFRTYDRNPVIPELRHVPGQPDDRDFRDPKVFWHEPTKRWVMAVAGGKLRFFSSRNLIEWHFESVDPSIDTECPDLFELPIDGDPSRQKWVLSGGGRWYLLGDFDGKRFTPTDARVSMDFGPDFYATQTWNDAPASRRVGISWLFAWNYNTEPVKGGIKNQFPTSPWSGGSFTVPTELSLKTTPRGVRLIQLPVAELDSFSKPVLQQKNLTLRPTDANPLAAVHGKTFDIRLQLAAAGRLTLFIPATGPHYAVTYDAASATIAIDRSESGIVEPKTFPHRYAAPLPAGPDGTVRLRILIDHSSLEIYGNDGETNGSAFILPTPEVDTLRLQAEEGAVTIRTVDVFKIDLGE